jgi:hypothetical protein
MAFDLPSDETIIMRTLLDIRADLEKILWLLGEGDDEETEDA